MDTIAVALENRRFLTMDKLFERGKAEIRLRTVDPYQPQAVIHIYRMHNNESYLLSDIPLQGLSPQEKGYSRFLCRFRMEGKKIHIKIYQQKRLLADRVFSSVPKSWILKRLLWGVGIALAAFLMTWLIVFLAASGQLSSDTSKSTRNHSTSTYAESLDSSNDSLDSSNDSLDSNNNSLDSNNNSLDSNNNSLDSNNNSLDSNNDSLDSNNDSLDSNNDSLDSNNDSLDSNNDSLDSNNDSLDSNNDSLDSSNDSLDSNNDSLDSNNDSLDSNNLQDSVALVYPKGILLTLAFDPESSVLNEKGIRDLREWLASDSFYSDAQYQVTGHCALYGNEQGRKKLSQERAQQVTDWLIRNSSLSGNQISPIGKGIDELLTRERSKQDLNRRVEIEIQP